MQCKDTVAKYRVLVGGGGGSIISSFMLVWFKLPGIASAVVFPTNLEKLYLFMHANLNFFACAKTLIKR